jgi:hypothetical protein
LNSAQVGDEYYTANSVRILTLTDLLSSYVPEDPVQVRVCCEMYETAEMQMQHTGSLSASA